MLAALPLPSLGPWRRVCSRLVPDGLGRRLVQSHLRLARLMVDGLHSRLAQLGLRATYLVWQLGLRATSTGTGTCLRGEVVPAKREVKWALARASWGLSHGGWRGGR